LPDVITKTATMTKPANSPDKPSPSDTPTHRPLDNGHKSVVKKADKEYRANQPHGGDIAKKHEKEEQPVGPGTKPPTEKGMDKGQVQPD
jgi:hypothetical protein